MTSNLFTETKESVEKCDVEKNSKIQRHYCFTYRDTLDPYLQIKCTRVSCGQHVDTSSEYFFVVAF